MRALIPVSGSPDERIAAIAAAQRGRVSRAQMRAAGISDGAIDRRVAKGQLHRQHRGVFGVGHLAPVPLGRETAALLACGAGAVLSHETAAAIWGLGAPGLTNAEVNVTVAGRQAGQPAGVRVHRVRQLDARDVRIHERLPVTSPARTLLDLADIRGTRDLERALDEAIALKIVRPSQVAELLQRSAAGRHGAPVLAGLLNDRARGRGRTRSEGEDRFFALLRAAQLPLPERNARLLGFTVDFLWREQGVVVEIDGYQWHSTKTAFERDHRKDAILKSAGIDLTRITWKQMDDEPYALIARLVQTLTQRSARRIPHSTICTMDPPLNDPHDGSPTQRSA